MNQRPSLMDQAGLSERTPAGSKKGGRGGGLGGQQAKFVVVGVLVLAALGVMAWRLGLFAGGPRVNKAEQAQRQEQFQEQVQEEQKAEQTGSRQRRTEAGG